MSRPQPDPLLLGLAAGDERAYLALLERYAGSLYRVAFGVLGRHEDAQDAVQEVFLAMVRSRRKLTDVHDLRAYLFTALRRAAARLVQRRAQQPSASPAVDDHAVCQPEPAASEGPYGDQLQRALRTLPHEQREVIALKIDGELTFAQIAQALGVSINTAASRYRYALEKLRAALRPDPLGRTSEE